jgi:tetratricopeptide (TPR) repeat protein
MPTLTLTLPEALQRAVAAFERRDWVEAERWCAVVLGAAPDEVEAIFLRALVQQRRGLRRAALENYERVLAIQPAHLGALNNRGILLADLKRYTESLASYDRALAIAPGDAETLNNRGIAFKALGRLADALASYDAALEVRPDYVDALNNRGNVLHALRRAEAALASYQKAQTARPDDPEAHWNESVLRLLTGDYVRGWPKYEWRWKREASNAAIWRDLPQPLWDGTAPLDGKTILLHAEQGLGDTIQFCRYAPAVAALRARVILGVQAPLRGLMGSLAGVTQIVAYGELLPAFDLQCPLLSLPRAFATTLETIPAETPYLCAATDALPIWESRLQAKRAGRRLRVGIAWSGNPAQQNDHNRSMTLEALLPLLDVDATFVSLQKDVRAGDVALLASRADILNPGGMLNDFSDTAALVMNLDLVVAVDTSVAHLAGALGKPVWVLLCELPDWRWLLDRETSPWYPSARLFRQQRPGDWAVPVGKVKSELQGLVAALAASPLTGSG